jgi:hypothetical protein
MWEIRSTPEDYRRLGNVDEAAWTWGLGRASGARHVVMVALTGGAMSLVDGDDDDCPDAVAQVHASEGLSLVESLLAETDLPKLVEMDEAGELAEHW